MQKKRECKSAGNCSLLCRCDNGMKSCVTGVCHGSTLPWEQRRGRAGPGGRAGAGSRGGWRRGAEVQGNPRVGAAATATEGREGEGGVRGGVCFVWSEHDPHVAHWSQTGPTVVRGVDSWLGEETTGTWRRSSTPRGGEGGYPACPPFRGPWLLALDAGTEGWRWLTTSPTKADPLLPKRGPPGITGGPLVWIPLSGIAKAEGRIPPVNGAPPPKHEVFD